ncbi:MAG: hypothetical protein ABI273_12350 [Lacunisphaera sp.]
MSNQGATVIRFVPKIKGTDVVATRVQSFSYDEKTARYTLLLDRELAGFWEPTFAFAAKSPNVLVFIFCRPDLALAVVDTSSGKIVLSKTFEELVPEFLDYRDRSTTTLQWCRQPFTSEGKLYLPGGILDGEDAKRGPSFVVDLASYEVTRDKE